MPDGKLTIFVSHVNEDEAIALSLKAFFEGIFLNAEVFVSGKDLAGGEVWFEELRAKLAISTTIVALVSKYSKGSNWVHFEAGAGFVRRRTIPLLLDQGSLSALKPPFSLLQARSFDTNGLSKLLADIATLARLRIPTKFPGIDELLRSVHDFMQLRESENIPEGATAIPSTSYRTIDSSLRKRMDELHEKAKTSIKDAVATRRNVFDLPTNSELQKMSFVDLVRLGEEVGLDLPFLLASRMSTAAMTVPYLTDAEWKKQAYRKDLEDLESMVQAIERKSALGGAA